MEVMRFISNKWIPVMAAAAAVLPLSAQEDLGPVAVTLGTTVPQAEGPAWAYVLWQETGLDFWEPRPFALYAKSGGADSPGSYSRVSVLTPQEDPLAITGLLRRSERLGEDLFELETRVDALFQDVLPAGSLSLGEKLSAILRTALVDDTTRDNLIGLGRLHPGVNLVLGLAWAGPFPGPGPATFEVRTLHPQTRQTTEVVGRVTLDPAEFRRLPAPGPPVQVPAVDARGHLNVLLRWGSPDDLRRLGLLQYGYNLWRVTPAFLTAEGINPASWQSGSPGNPEPGTLLWYRLHQPDTVVRVNNLPIIPERELTLAQAAAGPMGNPFDPDTPELFFFADDNNRFEPGAVPFHDGEEYVYFVTARDILGRDGHLSPGTAVILCDRMPPPVPREVRVAERYDYDADQQYLEVSWLPNPGSRPEESPTVRYHVYRWTSVDELYANAGDPLFNRITPPEGVAHVPGEDRLVFADRGPGAPAYPMDAARTFWYTVRAEDDGTCGGNLSGNSGPIWGVIREWEGPPAPSGTISTLCERFGVQFIRYEAGNDPAINEYLRLRILIVAAPGSTWAEARVGTNLGSPAFAAVTSLGRTGRMEAFPGYFFEISLTPQQIGDLNLIAVRIGNDRGTVSEWTNASFNSQLLHLPETIALFNSGRDLSYLPSDFDPSCLRHHSRGLDPEVDPEGREIPCVRGTLALTSRSREYKIYRRLGLNGPLVLIDQGLQDVAENPHVDWEDCTVPSMSGAESCYYGQVFDEHGNASPLVRFGCIFFVHEQLPTPMVARPRSQPGGNPLERPVTLKWFCPEPGVARFEIWIRPERGLPPQVISGDLTPNLAEPFATLGGAPGEEDQYFIYQTPPLVAGFGQPPVFEVELLVEEGVEYEVRVRAVGAGGFGERVNGPFGNPRTFSWRPVAPVPDPDGVPWPARPLPAGRLGQDAFPKMEARVIPVSSNGYAVGIRVGEYAFQLPWQEGMIDYSVNSAQVWQFWLPPATPAMSLFYPSESVRPVGPEGAESSILPFVLYRYHVPTERFPRASFEVVQVSPLVDRLSYVVGLAQFGQGTITIPQNRDPYFRALSDNLANPAANPTIGLYFLDTQPASLHSALRYLLVRYLPDGEIDDIFALPVVHLDVP